MVCTLRSKVAVLLWLQLGESTARFIFQFYFSGGRTRREEVDTVGVVRLNTDRDY